MRTFVTAAVIVLALGGPTQAASWKRYDAPSGFSVSIPAERFSVLSESEGRLSLTEVGGSAQLDIFGVTNSENLSVEQFEAMMEEADPGRRITYRASGRNWFVLSGYLKGEPVPTIFYAKFMLNRAGTALSAFEISYPATRRATFDPMVERIEDSLVAPRG